jgi:hypothetical protein
LAKDVIKLPETFFVPPEKDLIPLSGNTNRRGRLSTLDLLFKLAGFITKANKFLNTKMS